MTRRPNHDKSNWPEHHVWMGMRARCSNPNATGYERYGGRGIKVCERWLLFDNFIADMGRRPSERYSIDRINNDGDYCPENCRWADSVTQAINKGPARLFTIDGVTKSLSEWARYAGLSQPTLWNRLARGWSIEEAIAAPSAVAPWPEVCTIADMEPIPAVRKNITQPSDWWSAFEAAATRAGLPLAEWMGDICRDSLPYRVRSKLSERVRRGKKAKSPPTETT